jgi:hypothetical protein
MAGETPNNSDAALAKRHKQSAIVGRLTVACFVAMRSGYARKHLGAVFEELLVALAIRINDDLGMPALTASDIAKHLGVPRSNVRRCLDVLIGEGVVRKNGERGYRGELDWLAARIDAEYFLKIRDAIITAADELKALDAPA